MLLPEVCLKETRPWDKAAGIDFIFKRMDIDPGKGVILICGDTESDIPMVKYGLERNEKTYAVFVNPDETVKKSLINLFRKHPEQLCIVSCPEVIHAAMAEMLIS